MKDSLQIADRYSRIPFVGSLAQPIENVVSEILLVALRGVLA